VAGNVVSSRSELASRRALCRVVHHSLLAPEVAVADLPLDGRVLFLHDEHGYESLGWNS
jgi:hypothetical protein